jgi:RND family efflux transporter MFP subunit
MKILFLCGGVLLLSLATNGVHADTAPADTSAYVVTAPARMGTLPDLLTAYGTAVPALDASITLSIQAPGQVSHVAVTPGATVRRGQRLLDYALTPTAVAAYQQAQSALKAARAQQLHTAQLLHQQLATRDQLAQADKTLSDAQSTLAALRAQQGDQAVVKLTAPFDGVVGTLAVVQGDTLAAGAPLLTLVRTRGVQVTVGVELRDRQRVRAGAQVTLHSLDGGGSVSGTVTRVAAALDPRTRMLDVDIGVAAEVVVGGGFRAEITVGQLKGWLIPRDAVIGTAAHWRVFQVADGKAVAVPVTVIGETATTTVVSGALQAARPLVIVGGTQLEDGMAVRTRGAETRRAETAR